MKRRSFRVIIAAVLMLFLVGCMDLPNISDEQSNMIAEYAGGVLLRYSRQYDLRLLKNDVDGDGIEDSVAGVSGSAVATEEPTEKPKASPTADDGATAGPEESEKPVETEEPKVSLDELYGISGLHFSYQSSEFVNRYPEEGGSIDITPDEGQILYVVSFHIKNNRKKTAKVDLTTRPFHYELMIDGQTILPTISLLPNGGLNYLVTKIKAGATEEAVLIFNLDKSKKGTKGNTLSITEGDKTVTINL